MTDLPANVYRLPQRRFDAIPGAPWVYWMPAPIFRLFETLLSLDDIAEPRLGMTTSDNARFVRYWWEVPIDRIGVAYADSHQAQASGKRWFPYMKGGGCERWYGHQDFVVNWHKNGVEVKSADSYPRAEAYYFREGITYSFVTSSRFSARYLPPGFLFDVAGSTIFPRDDQSAVALLGMVNSALAEVSLHIINPTVNFQVGDLARIPVAASPSPAVYHECLRAIRQQFLLAGKTETTYDFITPPRWDVGIADQVAAAARLADHEKRIDDEIYRLYGISDADREAIESELEGGGALDHEAGESDEDTKSEEREEEASAGVMTPEELAVRWISYAVGVVLGRFRPGVAGALGRAVYRRDDFAIGSLPAPDEAEFDELVGPVERFAYVDATGGRHVFPAEVEQALSDLALIDGIAVLDEGHPRDLLALVEKALRLMLDSPKLPMVNRQLSMVNPADEVIAAGANGDLRKFLEKDFFTKWHLKWYRKRPVYWPLQSAKRGYGFVLFHEKVEKYTLYVLLRDYLDHKLNGLRLQIEDLLALAAGQTGAARRQTERQLDRVRQLLDEVNVFTQAIDRIVKGGYQPEANWIDDGVILRLAPLWELIPIWKAEPKKYWERLEGGDYDWSHIAMVYWPDRVRAACRVNKSFAIAHRHEEWYEGG